jgi:RNA polymerase sigma-70 factor, ECF subfamily
MTISEFNDFVRKSSRRLYTVAFRMLGRQEEAEDAVQEVFMKMWNMGRKLDGYESLEALSTSMTRNFCIDQIRKKKHISDEPLPEKGADSPAELMERAESNAILMKIIEELPESYRVILEMRDIKDCSYDEIAEKTGQNINTVRVNVSRARLIVRTEYKKYFNEKGRSGYID